MFWLYPQRKEKIYAREWGYFAHATGFTVLGALTMLCYYRCVFVGPGTLIEVINMQEKGGVVEEAAVYESPVLRAASLRGASLEAAETTLSTQALAADQNNHANQYPEIVENQFSNLAYTKPRWEFCFNCNTYKLWHSHHCAVCQQCIVRMDHHCPWIMGCVGYLNHRFFILFSLYSALWIASNSVFIYIHKNELDNFKPQDDIFYAMSSLVAVFSGFIFLSYFPLALKGYTIIEISEKYSQIEETEEEKRKKAEQDANNIGKIKMIGNNNFRDNLEVVFGTRNLFLAFIPALRNLPHPSTYSY